MPNRLTQRIRAAWRSFILGPAAVDQWSTVQGLSGDEYKPAEYGQYIATSNGVYACASLRADLLASLPMRLYKGAGESKAEVTTGPVRNLMDSVNPHWTRGRLISMTELSLCLWGEAFWFAERGVSGRLPPRELWWAKPDRVRVIPDPVDYVRGFFYQPVNGGAEVFYRPDEVIWLRYPNPLDEWHGLSPLAAARLSADTASAAMHSNRNLFSHGIQMGGMLMPPKGSTLSQEQATALEKALERRFSGSENAHRWAVFPYEYQISTPNITPKDAEFLGALRWALEDICRAYKVPLDLLGGQRSYENYSGSMKALWTQCILPEARLLASEINEQLLPMFAGGGVDEVEFDFSDVDVLQEGHGEKWSRAKEQIATGAITINEWREAEGLKPVPWGDAWWAPISVSPVSDASEPEATAAAAPQEEQAPEEPRGMRMLPFGEAEHQRVCLRWERRGSPWLKAWGRLCADLFKRQKDSIIGRLKAPKRDLGDVAGDPFNIAEWVKRFRVEARPLLAEMLQAFGAAALEDLAVEMAFDVFEPAVVRFLEQRAQRFAVEVNQTTWDALKSSLVEGLEAGDSMDIMAERVEAVMGERIRSSAEVIASTEVNGAQNGGTLLAWEQSGVVEGKEWVAALDARTRDDHVDAHGQVVGLDEDFQVGGFSGPSPGQMGDPSQDCNCVVPDTLVSGAFVGGLVADYAGPVWEIETVRGYRLTVTPNHPVLTDKGWIAAHALREGMNLLSYTENVGGASLVDVDDKNRPAPVQDVFEAIRANGRSRRAVLVGLDLHGDAQWTDGKVNVVGVDGILPGHIQTVSTGQHIEEGELISPASTRVMIEAERPLELDVLGVNASSAGLPGGSHLSVDAIGTLANARPLEPLRIGPAAYWNTSTGEKSKQGAAPIASFIGELLEAGAGLIAPDQIVRVRETHFRGHVYDLQSVDGWIIAQRIVISNCRCVMIAKVKGVN